MFLSVCLGVKGDEKVDWGGEVCFDCFLGFDDVVLGGGRLMKDEGGIIGVL